MKKIGLFYGSTTGNTETAATAIAAALGIGNVTLHDIADTPPETLGSYDNIIWEHQHGASENCRTTGKTLYQKLKASILQEKPSHFLASATSIATAMSFRMPWAYYMKQYI